METEMKRLNKFISETGYCSRREADKLIEEGRVTLNGVVPEMGTKVSPEDEIRIDGRLITEKRGSHVYLAFHKPVGIECTTNLEVRDNIVDYINYPKRIFPIGRLDKASEGLIFMTDDGDIVNKILRARNNHEKEYIVTVGKPITSRFIERMGNGVPILETVTRKCKVEQVSKYVFRIILTQGLNRQIRRMCEHLGYEVTALKRIRIINISLDVPVGRYRDLTPAEINELNTLIAPSSKTEEASLPPAPKTVKPQRENNRPGNNGRPATGNGFAKSFRHNDKLTGQPPKNDDTKQSDRDGKRSNP
ncbi:23S rRNA pseudouridine(2604) synthase RluF [Flavobacterium sp. RHBU_24]|uniref:23S rRNA pseudouridine(2604) synthase RluF n=1 Tax=Flavobacterium sp. RHBU_24 TaxID=3391185 RepID=UPI003985478F